MTENRSENAVQNETRGAGTVPAVERVTGNFAGSTDEILQWAACKWGIDEDLVRAQVVVESSWRQGDLGNFTTQSSDCIPGYPIGDYPPSWDGDDSHEGQCPRSAGLAQVWYVEHPAAYLEGNAVVSTAYNLDYAYARWRECFEGRQTWLPSIPGGAQYAAGDAVGCLGAWFSRAWYDDAATAYIERVNEHLVARTWTQQWFPPAQPRVATPDTTLLQTTSTSTPTTTTTSTVVPSTTTSSSTTSTTVAATTTTTTTSPVVGATVFVSSVRGDDVGGDGSAGRPWASIGRALDAVSSVGGVTVWVEPGVYGPVEVSRDFVEPVRVVGVERYRAVITGSSNPVLSVKSENLSFEGFEVVGQPSAVDSPGLVYFYGAHGSALRDNVVHDSYDNDLIRVLRSDDVVLAGNVFYNTGPGEHMVDVNGGSQRTIIEDNIVFSDYAGSGRAVPESVLAFIVVKFSGGDRTTGGTVIRRNVFAQYEGVHQALKIGSDGEAFFEAVDVTVENNLFHFAGEPVRGGFRVVDASGVVFRANTFVGDDVRSRFAGWVGTGEGSPPSEGVEFVGNVFSSPGGNMGDTLIESPGDLVASGSMSTNLYWNGGGSIPVRAGDVFNYTSDSGRVIADPVIGSGPVVLPRWNGNGFDGGAATIREAFVDYVRAHAVPAVSSPAGDVGYPGAPATDIFGTRRADRADLGAVEFNP